MREITRKLINLYSKTPLERWIGFPVMIGWARRFMSEPYTLRLRFKTITGDTSTIYAGVETNRVEVTYTIELEDMRHANKRQPATADDNRAEA